MTTEQQVRQKISEFESTLAAHRVDGLDLPRVFDLDATARRALQTSQDPDDDQLVRADTHGFLHLRYTVHLSPLAVEMFTTAADAISSSLRDVVVEIPELAIISLPLVAFIMSESGSIKAVAAASETGALALEGVFPSPFALPLPEGPGFWPDDHPQPHSDPGGNNTGTGTDDPWHLDDGGSGRKGPGDIWDGDDV
ncbi:hypothetical protein JK358_07440 [Nocardia sp. 2]|uniref:Uncharacterized protein n=1 Tax=Nocardia acididurans TaxID=2802282 RepID=A0ABS1M0N6_9NOCA|nr:hypothetical protein [Nocardia acididurans]MBL1074227.1 hypothetical protein [Nocardia acididurans]